VPANSNSPNRRFQVEWPVSPLHRLEITASVVAGFASLKKAGVLDLRIRSLPDPEAAPHITLLHVTDKSSGERRTVAFDEYDRNDRIDLKTLNEVDVYFKRSYYSPSLEGMEAYLRSRIHPSGLTFACSTPGSRLLLIRLALAAYSARMRASGLAGFKEANALLYHNAAQVEGMLPDHAYERRASDSIRDQVVFQTRIWPEEPDPTIDRGPVNRERLRLVESLRAEFDLPDLIGLLPTDYALAEAPHAVLSRKVGRAEYAQQLRTSLIAVNSHGLDGAAGFKLAESLAAGCALVSQPFLFELPEPLEPEVHFLPFQTPEECVAQCRRLMDDRELATRIRREAREYYLRNTAPSAHAWSLLTRAVELAS